HGSASRWNPVGLVAAGVPPFCRPRPAAARVLRPGEGRPKHRGRARRRGHARTARSPGIFCLWPTIESEEKAMDPRYRFEPVSELLSPSLVIFRDIVRQNLSEMITLARGAERLRPHVKTHKMAEVVRLAGSLGISKSKCATIAEAEMVAAAGGAD